MRGCGDEEVMGEGMRDEEVRGCGDEEVRDVGEG